MDLLSLNSFLHVASQPLTSHSRPHPFNRLPEDIMHLIVRYFLPTNRIHDGDFTRLIRVTLLQSRQARYPEIKAILYAKTSVDREVAWKNNLDQACMAELQKKAQYLFKQFWTAPYQTLEDVHFPSAAFVKQPCMTYIQRTFKAKGSRIRSHDYYISQCNHLMKHFENVEMMPNQLILDIDQKSKTFAGLAAGIAVGGMSCFIAKGLYMFRAPVTLLMALILAADAHTKLKIAVQVELAAGVQPQDITFSSLTSPTSLELLVMTVTYMCASILCAVKLDEVRVNSRIYRPIGMSRTQYFLFETPAKVKEIVKVISHSFTERRDLAYLFLLAKGTPVED